MMYLVEAAALFSSRSHTAKVKTVDTNNTSITFCYQSRDKGQEYKIYEKRCRLKGGVLPPRSEPRRC